MALEDLEQTLAAKEAEPAGSAAAKPAPSPPRRRVNRGNLPADLPREEILIDVADKTCPCCGGTLHPIGEDVSQRLDLVPARFRVLVTRRPKYACRRCEEGVVQAPAPARIVDAGIPTEALIAHVLVSKYADHLPLYRQAQIYARQGVDLDRSTLADWVGRSAWYLRPLHERLVVVEHPFQRRPQHLEIGLVEAGALRLAGAPTRTNAFGLLGRNVAMDPVQRVGHPVLAPHRSVLSRSSSAAISSSVDGSVSEIGFWPLPARFPRGFFRPRSSGSSVAAMRVIVSSCGTIGSSD